MEMLQQSIADTVCNAALDLAIDDERIDEVPAVVSDNIAENFDRSGLNIDRNFRDVAPVCVGCLARLEVMRCFQPGFDSVGQFKAWRRSSSWRGRKT